MATTLVSVIITTKNSGKTLKKLLESIKNQSYKDYEIIVVDNKSSDNTKKIAYEYTENVYDKGPERSAQRNFGAEMSKGELFFILDSDMVLEENVIKECVNEMKKGRDKEIAVPERSFGKGFWAKTKRLEREINTGEPFFESARFFTSKIFWEAKGYDLNLTGPEDWDLPQRIARKYQVARTKSFILHNEGKLSLTDLMRKKYYYGLSAYKYLKKNNLPMIGPTTVYFLRPAFYKNWRKIVKEPLISLGMIVMLTAENIAGACGYLMGRFF